MLNGVKLQIALWKGKKGGYRLSLDTNDEMGMTTEVLISKMLENPEASQCNKQEHIFGNKAREEICERRCTE